MRNFLLSVITAFILCVCPPLSAFEKPAPTPDPNPYTGEPSELINPFNGQFTTSCTDISSRNTGCNLAFRRFYSSDNAIKGVKSAGNAGSMGAGWATNFDYAVSAGSGGTKKSKKAPGLRLKVPNGKEYEFLPVKKQAETDKPWLMAGGRPWRALIENGLYNVYMDNLVYVFDAQGRLTGIKDRAGKGVAVEYGGITTTVTDTYGRKLFIIKDRDGTITSIAGSVENSACSFIYKNIGGINCLIKADRPGMEDAEYSYYEAGTKAGFLYHLLDLKNEGMGREITLSTPDKSPGIRYTGAKYGNGIIACGLDYGDGRRVKITDACGTRAYRFNPGGAVMEIVYPGGPADRMEYDADGRIIKRVFKAGFTEEYAWDENGFLMKKKTRWRDPREGAREKTEYFKFDMFGCLLEINDGNRKKESRTYDGEGRLLSFSKGTCRTDYQYNAEGLVEIKKDSEGAGIKYGYDGFGSITSAAYMPGGYGEAFTYDGSFRISSHTGVDGVCMKYNYSNAFPLKPESISMDGHEVAGFGYDNRGNTTYLKDDYGTATYLYDTDLLTGEKDRAGLLKSYEHDSFGRMTGARDTSGCSRRYVYNENGAIAEIYDSYNRSYEYTYDKMGNTETVKDRNGNKTQYCYDGLGRLMSTIGAGGVPVVFDYDDYGNKTAVSCDKKSPVVFSFDANSRLTRESYADGTRAEYEYSPEGDPVKILVYNRYGRRVKEQRLTYDGMHRLVDDGFLSYEYGSQGFPWANRVTGIRGHGEFNMGFYKRFVYDKKWRISQEDDLETDVNENAHKFTIRLKSDIIYDVLFDGQGRSTEIHERSGANDNVIRIKRDQAGKITDIFYPNLDQAGMTRDAEGRVVLYSCSYRGTGAADLSGILKINYDYEGNRSAEISGLAVSWSGSTSRTYDYDGDNRLKYMDGYRWVYDRMGNRISSSEQGAGDLVYSADYMGRYRMQDGYSYDESGTRVGLGATPLDDINYMPEFYGYTGGQVDNRELTGEIIGRGRKARIPLLVSYGAAYCKAYISDGDWIFGAIEKNTDDYTRTYFMPDSLGSVAAVCGENGSNISVYTYSPFGICSATNSADGNSLRFKGMSGAVSAGSSVYFGDKCYDTITGRLLARDKDNIFEGRNFYEFMGNNPFREEKFRRFIGGIDRPRDSGERDCLRVPDYPDAL